MLYWFYNVHLGSLDGLTLSVTVQGMRIWILQHLERLLGRLMLFPPMMEHLSPPSNEQSQLTSPFTL